MVKRQIGEGDGYVNVEIRLHPFQSFPILYRAEVFRFPVLCPEWLYFIKQQFASKLYILFEQVNNCHLSSTKYEENGQENYKNKILLPMNLSNEIKNTWIHGCIKSIAEKPGP
jgi:hypothetical protein